MTTARPILRPAVPQRFWLVWRTDSKRTRKRHPTRDAAIVEANRLAALFPGRTFYVLESIKRVARRPPVSERLPPP